MIRGKYKHLLPARREALRKEFEGCSRGEDGVLTKVGGCLELTMGDSAKHAMRALLEELGIMDYVDVRGGARSILVTLSESEIPEEWDMIQKTRQSLIIRRAQELLDERDPEDGDLGDLA